jgi:hypothetical protein
VEVVSEKKAVESEISHQMKVEVILNKPKIVDDTTQHVHVPSPVPIPTGDLHCVIKDVFAVQKQQPWLISSEARVPSSSLSTNDLSESQLLVRDKTSRQLKDELERKHRNADAWSKGNGSMGNGDAKAAQFHKLRSQRQK